MRAFLFRVELHKLVPIDRLQHSSLVSSGQSAQGKHLGRPPIAGELERKGQRHLRTGTGILKVAKMVGLGTGTVHRIKREMAG
jgi:hypothetical protein